jgi:hypothetical protein
MCIVTGFNGPAVNMWRWITAPIMKRVRVGEWNLDTGCDEHDKLVFWDYI